MSLPHSFRYKVICPIDVYPYVNEETHPEYTAAIDDIVSCSEQIDFVEIKTKKFKPRIFREFDYLPKHPQTRGRYNCLVFEVTLPSSYKLDAQLEQKYIEERRYLRERKPPEHTNLGNKWKNADRLVYQVYYFLALTQIAHPGIVDSQITEVYIDDEFFYYGVPLHTFLHFHFSRYNKWPEVRDIPMRQVFDWLKKHKISFLKKSEGISHRAVYSLFQLFSTNNYSISHHLMWAMNGLEAIYTEDRGDITEQMIQNSQQILGENGDLYDPIRKMYIYRSNYAHGSLNMFPLYYEADITIPEVNQYFRETERHMRLAIEMLVMSIQAMVTKDVKKFRFKPLILPNKKPHEWVIDYLISNLVWIKSKLK